MDWIEENKQRLQELPPDIRKKSIRFLSEFLTPEQKRYFQEKMEENPHEWWAQQGWHFRGGMYIRNKLREVALDDALPSGNWDDYYIAVMEEAIRSGSYHDWDQW
jgi:hypothetical protein